MPPAARCGGESNLNEDDGARHRGAPARHDVAMASTTERADATFRVLDAMDAPHGGRILRLRLQSGEAPSVKALKGARLRAVGPDGAEKTLRVDGFAVFGGRTSDERLARTGRVDVHVSEEGEAPRVGMRWEVSLLR